MNPALPTPRQRDEESEPLPEPETVSESTRDDIFNLIATRPLEDGESEAPEDPPPVAAAAGRSVHTIGISDLSRLSIDNDGRLSTGTASRSRCSAAS
jgi:predicted component of type VI protein secretion system